MMGKLAIKHIQSLFPVFDICVLEHGPQLLIRCYLFPLLLLLSCISRVQLQRPHRWQLTRFLCPWDSPGKNTGVGCHFLLQCMKVKSESEVVQSCLTLVTPWTGAYQAHLSMGFSRQEYWGGQPFPFPGDLPDSGIKFRTPALQAESLLSEPPGKP